MDGSLNRAAAILPQCRLIIIDSGRATLLVAALLSAIEQHHAMVVLMDVTGVPIVDTRVARVPLQAADAARLLGAEPRH